MHSILKIAPIFLVKLAKNILSFGVEIEGQREVGRCGRPADAGWPGS